ncbi:uncharacterized protein ACA1_025730, partial [Acanthamoeba castellanii str. Neff]
MSNTAISLALIVEDDGRTTEVVRDGSALEVARTIVRKIDNGDDGKKSFEDKGHRFDVWVADRVVFLAAAKQGAAKQRVCFEFLGTIRQEYDVKGYADQQNVSSFKKFVEAQLDRFSDYKNVDKIGAVQAKADEVKDIALQNLDRLLERQGKDGRCLREAEGAGRHVPASVEEAEVHGEEAQHFLDDRARHLLS